MNPEWIPQQQTLNSEDLKKQLLSWGATLVGFGDVSFQLAPEFHHIPRAISLAIKHPPVWQGEVSKDKGLIYFHQHLDLDKKLEEIQQRVVRYLRALGWKALAIPPDSDKMDTRFIAKIFSLFPHKTAATCSGLGWIGKNGLLINPQYGPGLSWATILTNAPLAVSGTPFLKANCGSCQRCVAACPAGAILNNSWIRSEVNNPLIDMEACRSQLNKNYQSMGKFACGCCVLACTRSLEG